MEKVESVLQEKGFQSRETLLRYKEGVAGYRSSSGALPQISHGNKFSLPTNHVALAWSLRFKNPEGQLKRWLERLQEYNFKIQHPRGRLHGNADGLSRRPYSECW